ncbi:lysylphosphatidylglycerol synthase transmembrane domain-containing protein [Pseudodesulfovibrio sp.]|uniref:lysylphosphatidylglycerol synthase transmembrane domain-containing protein n=1 Tax=Pseudodesulfovibrio sp. TaxID=2035812 RepID=UPI002637A3E7|nr:lysylphosphatidylglycerol synthase transmembrane domain-containing protein [Pseudodesulfovibrio sp.]MDD3312156.1 lysylphosphatidylglycerol synthase transmembrane domain-containing protein [Pseudodesulfovibrio sp.]
MAAGVAKYGKPALQLGVAALLVWAIFYFRIISVSDLVGLGRHPWALAFFCCCMCALYVLSSVRWHLLLGCLDMAPPFAQTLRITYIGSFWAASLLGGMASEFSRAYMIFRQSPDAKRKGAISIVVDKVASLAALLLWACVCVAFKYDAMSHSPLFRAVSVFLALGGAFFVLFVGMLFLNRRRLGFSSWVERRFGGGRIAEQVLLVTEAFYLYRSRPGVLLSVLGISILNQGIMVLILYQTGVLLGGVMSFLDVGISGPLTVLLNMLPISPGGLGVGEVAYAQINAILNPASSLTVSGTVFLTFRIISVVTSLPAVLFLFRKGEKR